MRRVKRREKSAFPLFLQDSLGDMPGGRIITALHSLCSVIRPVLVNFLCVDVYVVGFGEQRDAYVRSEFVVILDAQLPLPSRLLAGVSRRLFQISLRELTQ